MHVLSIVLLCIFALFMCMFFVLFLKRSYEVWAMGQVFQGGGVCETLPENVCDAIPTYCTWKEVDGISSCTSL